LNDNFKENIDLAVHIFPCKPENCKNCVLSDCKHRVYPFEEKIHWTIKQIIRFK